MRSFDEFSFVFLSSSSHFYFPLLSLSFSLNVSGLSISVISVPTSLTAPALGSGKALFSSLSAGLSGFPLAVFNTSDTSKKSSIFLLQVLWTLYHVSTLRPSAKDNWWARGIKMNFSLESFFMLSFWGIALKIGWTVSFSSLKVYHSWSKMLFLEKTSRWTVIK